MDDCGMLAALVRSSGLQARTARGDPRSAALGTDEAGERTNHQSRVAPTPCIDDMPVSRVVPRLGSV